MTYTPDELQATADAASPGPWEVHPDDPGVVRGPVVGVRRCSTAVTVVRYGLRSNDEAEANARFCAAARVAVPELVARVLELEAVAREYLSGLEAAEREEASLRTNWDTPRLAELRRRIARVRPVLADGGQP